jgi:Thioredoxin like C-terminal domain
VPFQVLLDGEPAGPAHGADVDGQGHGMITEPRLYQLIRQPGLVTERIFQVTFRDPGVEAYAFTFG